MRLLLACLLSPRPPRSCPRLRAGGDLKYPPGFRPLRLRQSCRAQGGGDPHGQRPAQPNFDKYNPFTIEGAARRPICASAVRHAAHRLARRSGAAYGLLAEDVAVRPIASRPPSACGPRRLSINGDAVTAQGRQAQLRHADGPCTSPRTRPCWSAWPALDATGRPHRALPLQKRPNRELPLTVGVPVFSTQMGRQARSIAVMDEAIGSGPYRIGPVKFRDKDITYVRDPNYWARDLNVKRGDRQLRSRAGSRSTGQHRFGPAGGAEGVAGST